MNFRNFKRPLTCLSFRKVYTDLSNKRRSRKLLASTNRALKLLLRTTYVATFIMLLYNHIGLAVKHTSQVRPITPVKQVRPIMHLHAGVARGLCNQRSVMLTSLYLATLLNWDILLPYIYSPLNCSVQSPSCYAYNKYTRFPFGSIYDEKHFVNYVNKEYMLRVYTSFEQVPKPYAMVHKELRPCKGLCRGTYDVLVKLYSNIDGHLIVDGPGIAAGFLNSLAHYHGLQRANQAFRHNELVNQAANHILNETSNSATFIAIHWRFEEDVARKKLQLLNQTVFLNKIETQLLKLNTSWKDENISFYLAGGLPTSAAESVLRMMAQRLKFQHVHIYDKRGGISGNNAMTFFNAAVDFEVSCRAGTFFGHPFSSFSAFIASERYQNSQVSHLVPSFDKQYGCDMLTSFDANSHWQYELTLPLQPCLTPDPCRMFYLNADSNKRKTMAYMLLKNGCPTHENMHVDITHCTGMTLLMKTCDKNNNASVLTGLAL